MGLNAYLNSRNDASKTPQLKIGDPSSTQLLTSSPDQVTGSGGRVTKQQGFFLISSSAIIKHWNQELSELAN